MALHSGLRGRDEVDHQKTTAGSCMVFEMPSGANGAQ